MGQKGVHVKGMSCNAMTRTDYSLNIMSLAWETRAARSMDKCVELVAA